MICESKACACNRMDFAARNINGLRAALETALPSAFGGQRHPRCSRSVGRLFPLSTRSRTAFARETAPKPHRV